MGLPGSKNACEQGECGSCTVRLDGVPVCSCLVAAGQVEGREVVTVEGLADFARQRAEHGGCATGACGGGTGEGTSPDEAKGWAAKGQDSQTGEGTELSPIQQAFIDAGAVQCGFCTPGLLVAADEMLERNAEPDRRRHPRGAVGQPVPLHRLREDPGRGPPRGRPRRPRRSDHGYDRNAHQPHPGLPDQGRHRRVDAAPRRHPQGHRRVRVLLRHVARGHAVGLHPALHRRARRDRVHRHLRGPRAPPASTPSSPTTTCPPR